MHTMKSTAGLLFALCTSIAAGAAFAQSYPVKPVKFIVPYAPGGSTDPIARVVARKMTEGLGQPIVLENHGGAGGRIGTELASRAAGDGYTLLFGTITTLGLAPSLFPKLPYDPIKSFAPISLLTLAPSLVTVIGSVPANSMKELVALAKAKPGQLNFASIGPGSVQHFTGEALKKLAGIDIVHIPYQGSGAELAGLLAGQVQIGFDILSSFQLQNYQSGKLRALAVLGPSRIPQLPSVPTTAEAGYPGLEANIWFGLLAVAGTPATVVKRLNEEVQKALAAKEVRDTISSWGLEPKGNSSEEFAAWIRDEVAKWAKIIKESGFKTD